MKTRRLILLAITILATVLVSCTKDPDVPVGKVFNSGSGGGETDNYTITVSANPSEGGSVSGGGTYKEGRSCTVKATANSGYTFSKWMENGTQVSTSASFVFEVTTNRTLVAYFSTNAQDQYTINVSASPSEGGSVSGGGTYEEGQSCTLTATAVANYTFDHWTKDGSTISGGSTITFTVTQNASYVAYFNFTGGSGGNVPAGAINGQFTINSSGDKVYFSQGNLQYNASTNTWRFATNQYESCAHDNSNISSSYSGWIDLFGWGTSGYNHGAVCYQPWSTSQRNSDYYAYGSDTYNLYDQTGKADWGYHAISNGGNTTNTWRTLTTQEWGYIFNTRNTTSGIRYAKASVNNVNGVVLLPDDWSSNYYSLSNTNTGSANYTSNKITLSQWSTLEQHGAVFLPAAGYRYGTSVIWGSYGYYWSASYYNRDNANGVLFYSDFLYPSYSDHRYLGRSVRLIASAE